MLAFPRTILLLLSAVFAIIFFSSVVTVNAAPIPERAASAVTSSSSLQARSPVFDGNALYNFASMMGRDEHKTKRSPQMMYAPTTYTSGATAVQQLRRGNPPPPAQQQQQPPPTPGAPSVPKKHKESIKEKMKNGWKKFTHGIETVGKKVSCCYVVVALLRVERD
jgi:hypothetical protein